MKTNTFTKLSIFYNKGKYLIISFFVLISVISGLIINGVKVNYDSSKYLPKDLQTSKALEVLESEFTNNGYLQVMIEDIDISEINDIYDNILTIDGISSIIKDEKSINGSYNVLFKITLTNDNYSLTSSNTIEKLINALSNYTVYLNQDAYIIYNYNNLIEKEIPKIILFLLPIILLILFLTSSSWLEPLLFIIVIGVSVIINMGTNILFSDISYMSEAIAPILQFALCMDYSIMLLHRYQKIKKTNVSTEFAVTLAIKETFVPILSSSLTTIAGFVSLMFMRYQIGLDIGLVLAKGVILSILTVLLLLPALILVFSKPLDKLNHKVIFKVNNKLSAFIKKTRYIIPIIALVIIISSFFIQKQNKYYYSDTTVSNQTEEMILNNEKIDLSFGKTNNIIILIPNDSLNEISLIDNINKMTINNKLVITEAISYNYIFNNPYSSEELNQLLQSMGYNIDKIDLIYNYMKSYNYITDKCTLIQLNNFVNTYLLNNLTPGEREMFTILDSAITEYKKQFVSTNYSRILLNVDIPYEDDDTFNFANDLLELVNKTIPNSYIVGSSIATNDIKNTIENDYTKVTIITIILIFFVVLLSFKSIAIPLILILLIQGAIYINMAFPVLFNDRILFIGYIIVSCIQLGATIDYGIFLSNRYIENRNIYSKDESFIMTIKESFPVVLTSGLILIFAGFSLGLFSTVPVISILGMLIGRGALFSVLLVLFVLPQVLYLLDRLICKKRFVTK